MTGTCRYVVLHHTGVPVPHFDLMIDFAPDRLLATWRLAHWPPKAGDVPEPITPHRRDYLHYEGPISDSRGWVERIDDGHCACSCDDGVLRWQIDTLHVEARI